MRFRRNLRPMAEINLLPMIDVLFQLIIFFMIATTFTLNPGISMVLPESSTAEPVAMTKLVVSITSEQEIYLNDKKYDLASMSGALTGFKQSSDTIKTVVVEADRSVPYELMIKVLDVLRKNDFKGINLRTRVEPKTSK